MALYYLQENGIVTDVVSPPDGTPMGAGVAGLTAEQAAAAIEIPLNVFVTRGMKVPEGGFVSPSNVPTQAQQAQALLSKGITVTSTSGAWVANFSVTTGPGGTPIWSMITAEQMALLSSNNTEFADGEKTLQWPDITSTPQKPSLRNFNPQQASEFFKKVGTFTAQCRNVINGVPGAVLPNPAITIP